MFKRERTALALPLFLILNLLPAWSAADRPVPGPAAKLRIVDLAGTPYEMGMVHGLSPRLKR
jgi:hypothetical protein